jgi:hypothetical protein
MAEDSLSMEDHVLIGMVFSWDDQESISGFHADNNETFEASIVFYNYDDGAYAYEWGGTTEGTYWETDQPSSYLDTQALDNEDERDFCVGCADANELEPGTSYLWWGKAPKASEGSSAKVNIQRGYRFPSFIYTTWSVFAEQTVIKIPFTQWTTPGDTSW